MTNTSAWDAVAARHQDDAAPGYGAVRFGPDVADDASERLVGSVAGKRVLDLGCGTGQAAITFARQGAHAIGIDASAAMLTRARHAADAADVRVEWHQGDVADLAFLGADSVDLAFSARALGEVDDLDRVFRQVHRVLRHAALFVFSLDHPVALCVGRAGDDAPGGLALGALEVRRSYFDDAPAVVDRDGEPVMLHPRRTGDVFAALHRAGYRVEAIRELAPPGGGDAALVPTICVWRSRKEGV